MKYKFNFVKENYDTNIDLNFDNDILYSKLIERNDKKNDYIVPYNQNDNLSNLLTINGNDDYNKKNRNKNKYICIFFILFAIVLTLVWFFIGDKKIKTDKISLSESSISDTLDPKFLLLTPDTGSGFRYMRIMNPDIIN